MCRINLLDKLSFILVIIGAFNWGLVGLFNFNLISKFFSLIPSESITVFLSRLLYILIGLAAVNISRFLITCYKTND
ncbi:MAG: DUF378 domain-containing protein [Clostridium argentinense]|uniref:DUF378 domain-containing protein n=1 Tax=Clostridium faecium TaxID=2762223 RepID=A0ABR8YN66_9CLOT|nr:MULTISPECIES: DUF378 domain-containing protein [Clostridium]MBD8045491.1 DUF378 domain-containing protein [Clostridium faecium]MBS5825431.1 DUF378 domain-containing protein [Clostridium argentinense]MDU1348920.1 DUF378 domain-containing protein [Clostridium argentinense]